MKPRAKLPNGKVQYLLVEWNPIAKVVKILSRATDDLLIERGGQSVHETLRGYNYTRNKT